MLPQRQYSTEFLTSSTFSENYNIRLLYTVCIDYKTYNKYYLLYRLFGIFRNLLKVCIGRITN